MLLTTYYLLLTTHALISAMSLLAVPMAGWQVGQVAKLPIRCAAPPRAYCCRMCACIVDQFVCLCAAQGLTMPRWPDAAEQ